MQNSLASEQWDKQVTFDVIKIVISTLAVQFLLLVEVEVSLNYCLRVCWFCIHKYVREMFG